MNDGSGRFPIEANYSISSTSYAVELEDVNGDNKPDIIVANTGSNTVGVLLNTGTGGTFSPQVT